VATTARQGARLVQTVCPCGQLNDSPGLKMPTPYTRAGPIPACRPAVRAEYRVTPKLEPGCLRRVRKCPDDFECRPPLRARHPRDQESLAHLLRINQIVQVRRCESPMSAGGGHDLQRKLTYRSGHGLADTGRRLGRACQRLLNQRVVACHHVIIASHYFPTGG